MIRVLLCDFIKLDKTATLSHVGFFKNFKEDIELIILGNYHETLKLWYKHYGYNPIFSNEPIQSFFNCHDVVNGILILDYSTCLYPNKMKLSCGDKIVFYYKDNPYIYKSQTPIYLPKQSLENLGFLFFHYFQDKESYDVRLLNLTKDDFISHQSSVFS
jgi:hypothetical protein